MTEAEWLTGTDTKSMLEFLRDKGGERKLRLFACACCREVWDWLEEAESREAVEVAERYADGLATLEVLLTAYRNAQSPAAHSDPAANAAWNAAAHPADEEFSEWYRPVGVVPTAVEVAWNASGNIWEQNGDEGPDEWPFKKSTAQSVQADLLRDIFNNPFRPAWIDPVWLVWNDGTVVKIAQGIYDERAFDRLPVLADALEDAGCHDTAILNHCRRPGQHVRGCWVVDLLTGRT
jgi:hypothetical protein